MRALMRDIVNRLYTFHLHADDPKLQAQIERWVSVTDKWDAPEVDPRMISSSCQTSIRRDEPYKCGCTWQDGRAWVSQTWMGKGRASVGICARNFSLVRTC